MLIHVIIFLIGILYSVYFFRGLTYLNSKLIESIASGCDSGFELIRVLLRALESMIAGLPTASS